MSRRLLLGAGGGGGETWTPEDLTSLQVWGTIAGITPQETGTGNLTGWTAEAGSPSLDTVNGSPDVIESGDRFAAQFDGATERVIKTGTSITKPNSGAAWCVFAIRSGASTGANHGLLSVGAATSSTRRFELRMNASGGALYPGVYVQESTNLRSLSWDTAIADTNWHSLLVEYNAATPGYRFWVDETLIDPGDLTDGTVGTPPTWLGSWSGAVAANRIGVACAVVNSSPADHANCWFRDWGISNAALTAGETTSLLAHLAAYRG